jgi:hypothetical protein
MGSSSKEVLPHPVARGSSQASPLILEPDVKHFLSSGP